MAHTDTAGDTGPRQWALPPGPAGRPVTSFSTQGNCPWKSKFPGPFTVFAGEIGRQELHRKASKHAVKAGTAGSGRGRIHFEYLRSWLRALEGERKGVWRGSQVYLGLCFSASRVRGGNVRQRQESANPKRHKQRLTVTCHVLQTNQTLYFLLLPRPFIGPIVQSLYIRYITMSGPHCVFSMHTAHSMGTLLSLALMRCVCDSAECVLEKQLIAIDMGSRLLDL